MSDDKAPQEHRDMESISDIADRVVAANLTSAIYTRLHTVQSREGYDESAFDDVARTVVREVMQTYSALLGVFRGMHDDDHGTASNGQ